MIPVRKGAPIISAQYDGRAPHERQPYGSISRPMVSISCCQHAKAETLISASCASTNSTRRPHARLVT
eukprot:scaffold106464_cov68-Phaeocystis_antarctica.AAC.1